MVERIKTLWVKPQYLAHILEGRKRVEVRVGYDNIRRLQPGDLIRLNGKHSYAVVRVARYPSFEEMLKHEEVPAIAPDLRGEELLARCREIYHPTRKHWE